MSGYQDKKFWKASTQTAGAEAAPSFGTVLNYPTFNNYGRDFRGPDSTMAQDPQQDITRLLIAWGEGDEDALDKLMPFVYGELRRLAHAYMRRQRPDHTLQTTALVNEAYMRLIDSNRVKWQDRNHFFAMSAKLMRRILVDFARTKNAQKRGGGEYPVTFDEELPVADVKETELLALDEALTRLAEMDERQSRIVELKYFGGLTEEEIAEVLEISPRTVRRDWSVARAWLFNEINKN